MLYNMKLYTLGDPVLEEYLVLEDEFRWWTLPVPLKDIWQPGGVPFTPAFLCPTNSGVVWQFVSSEYKLYSLGGPHIWFYMPDGTIYWDSLSQSDKVNIDPAVPFKQYLHQETYQLPALDGGQYGTLPSQGYDIGSFIDGYRQPDEVEWKIENPQWGIWYQYGPEPDAFGNVSISYSNGSPPPMKAGTTKKLGDRYDAQLIFKVASWPYIPPDMAAGILPQFGALVLTLMGLGSLSGGVQAAASIRKRRHL